jgi:hydroxymethylpyrimidine/phosphomethylpyrimidine kinase
MPENRPFVLSIAGFDPSEAGILADCKTLNSTKFMVWLSILQIRSRKNEFFELEWTPLDFTIRSMKNFSILMILKG